MIEIDPVFGCYVYPDIKFYDSNKEKVVSKTTAVVRSIQVGSTILALESGVSNGIEVDPATEYF